MARTSEYLNWRYADHPYFAYRILIAEDGKGEMRDYLIFRLAISSGSADEYHIVHIFDLIAEENADSANWYITKGDGDKDRPNPV